MEQLIDSRLRKEYNRAASCHPVCLMYMLSTSMRNAWLDDLQARIKIGRRNINNLRHVDDSTVMAESEEELISLLKKVIEDSEKVGLKLNIHKTKIMASGPITS